jgi:tetratricopeptide (TPR) repeat protein
MNRNPEPLADWEVPAGSLAEEAVATEPRSEEPASFDDVEFLFLTDDEPKLAVHGDAPGSSSDDVAVAPDFLFPFDLSPSQSLEATDAAEESFGDDGPDSTFPLTRLLERERLEEEIGKLRGELERHRAILSQMREGESLPPAPIRRRPQAHVHLPVAADVLATVGDRVEEVADFRDSEEFRSFLPKARALLGYEGTEGDETLLQIVSGESPSFRALAPVGRRLPMLAFEGPIAVPRLPASDPPVDQVEIPVERSTNEFVASVRWWNAIPAVAAFAAVVAGFATFSFGLIGQSAARASLRDALHGAPMRAAEVDAVLADVDGTYLSRYDGRFDYLLARLQDYANAKANAKELLSSRRMVDPRVVKFVDRAVERTPGLGWHRLTRAALASSQKSPDADEFWKEADAGRIDDPLYWEILGDHYRMSGRKDDALVMFANTLRRKPTAARDVLAMLSEVRIDLNASLGVVPPHPVAALQAAKFVKTEEGRRDWRELGESLLQRLGEPKAAEDGDELSARGQLQLMLGKLDDAAASFELALAKEPERNDFRLELAKLKYEQKRFDEAGTLAEKIVHAEPASGLGEEARVLRNKIELSTSGRRPGAKSAAN